MVVYRKPKNSQMLHFPTVDFSHFQTDAFEVEEMQTTTTQNLWVLLVFANFTGKRIVMLTWDYLVWKVNQTQEREKKS